MDGAVVAIAIGIAIGIETSIQRSFQSSIAIATDRSDTGAPYSVVLLANASIGAGEFLEHLTIIQQTPHQRHIIPAVLNCLK